jgi:hypothetical protein
MPLATIMTPRHIVRVSIEPSRVGGYLWELRISNRKGGLESEQIRRAVLPAVTVLEAEKLGAAEAAMIVRSLT